MQKHIYIYVHFVFIYKSPFKIFIYWLIFEIESSTYSQETELWHGGNDIHISYLNHILILENGSATGKVFWIKSWHMCIFCMQMPPSPHLPPLGISVQICYSSFIIGVYNKYNWPKESKTTVTDYVRLPDQVSSSLKTRQGSCQTIVDGLSTVTMWMNISFFLIISLVCMHVWNYYSQSLLYIITGGSCIVNHTSYTELESCQFKLSLSCAGNYSWEITSKTFHIAKLINMA